VKPGIVVLHGLGGSPASVGPVRDALDAAGFDVTAPLLPGHGSAPEALVGVTWEDLRGAVIAAVDATTQRRGATVLVGQSIGATLALDVAARRADVVGLALVNARSHATDPDAIEFVEGLIARGKVLQRQGPADLHDPEAVDVAYDALPHRTLIEADRGAAFARDALGVITVPALVVSSDHDAVIDPSDSDAIAGGLAGAVRRVRLARGGHAAALDVDRDVLVAALLGWLAELTGDLTDGSGTPG
jgi:carboxylesterase